MKRFNSPPFLSSCLTAVLVWFFVTTAFIGIGFSGERVPVVVKAVTNHSREKQFSKLLIADGIRDLVGQALFDSGCFVPLETEGEAVKNLQSFSQKKYGDPGEKTPWIVNVTIDKVKKSRSSANLLVFSTARTKVIVEVVLEIKGEAGIFRKAIGKGEAKMRSRGVLFQIRNDKIYFDETGIGRAVRDAVNSAVEKMVKSLGNCEEI